MAATTRGTSRRRSLGVGLENGKGHRGLCGELCGGLGGCSPCNRLHRQEALLPSSRSLKGQQHYRPHYRQGKGCPYPAPVSLAPHPSLLTPLTPHPRAPRAHPFRRVHESRACARFRLPPLRLDPALLDPSGPFFTLADWRLRAAQPPTRSSSISVCSQLISSSIDCGKLVPFAPTELLRWVLAPSSPTLKRRPAGAGGVPEAAPSQQDNSNQQPPAESYSRTHRPSLAKLALNKISIQPREGTVIQKLHDGTGTKPRDTIWDPFLRELHGIV
ncbi:uncharacterized protein LOC131382597 [Hylobates moloch]|uniref:uncharacterized protein LOC131382597 n=1 Tax=Hylobates moloch TaxID=81572 RepID=UPI00267479F6|nr:uncharacterized protein LOC131382597 [Hylobates moloch]